MQQYSLHELQTQLAQVQKALGTPGIHEDEAKIYRETIGKINQKINELTARQPAITPPRPNVPSAIHARTTAPPQRVNENVAIGPHTPTTTTTQPLGPATLTTDLLTANPQITIEWGDNTMPETLNEATARSRFTSRLRDLENSTRARQQRWDQLNIYTAWWRAIGYYRALTIFWAGSSPTMQQLGIKRASATYRHLFTLVTEAATQ